MKNLKIKITLLIILVFAIMQVIPSDRPENKEPDSTDLLQIEKPNAEIGILIKSACYDCHSYQSKHPWYSDLAPVSWWVNDHIEEGREHLNFSEWGTYSPKKKAHKAEEGVEELEEGEMPLWSYQLGHSEATLNDSQKEMLIEWFASLEKKYK